MDATENIGDNNQTQTANQSNDESPVKYFENCSNFFCHFL